MRRRNTMSRERLGAGTRWLLDLRGVTLHWVRWFAEQQVGKQGADDLAQTTIVRLLTRSNAPDSEHPRAFLAAVVRNLATDHARQFRARGGPALALDDLPDASAPWIAPDQETALLLKQVILALPPIYRDTFVLNRFMGLTYAEIAQRYGITVKAVEYRISRALALCQDALRD